MVSGVLLRVYSSPQMRLNNISEKVMSRGINKSIIIGTLGQDPEVRQAANGNAVVNVSVAVNESWKDKATGETKEATEWIRIVMFGKLGEIAGQYLKKGSQAYFEGKMQTRSYDKDGVKMYSTEVIANVMQMLGSRGEQGESRPQGRTEAPSGNVKDDFHDDIPF